MTSMRDYDTRQSLLIRIRDGDDDQDSWSEFVDLYSPLVYRFASSRGVPEGDRADVVQEIFKAIAGAIGRFEYDRDKATFRAWLFTVCRSKINSFHSARKRRPIVDGSTAMMEMVENHPDPSEVQDWETDYRRHMFQWAASKTRHEFAVKTWDAFWKTAVENRDIDEVAGDLDMSKGAIYVAKSRVLARLRQQIASVAGEWDGGIEPG